MPGQLSMLVAQCEPKLSFVDEGEWHTPLGPGKWTRLQVLGHLIDSAANNHQRFVRALAQPRLDWPGYDQVAHVEVQHYAEADPALCVSLWSAYNRFLGYLIDQVPAGKAGTVCSIEGAPEMRLSDLILDYVAHLEHHLRQLLPDYAIEYSGMPWPPADVNRQWRV